MSDGISDPNNPYRAMTIEEMSRQQLVQYQPQISPYSQAMSSAQAQLMQAQLAQQAIMRSFPSTLNPMPPVGIGHGAAVGQLYGSYAISIEEVIEIGHGDYGLGIQRIKDFVDGSRVTPTFPAPPVDIAALIWANRDEKVE